MQCTCLSTAESSNMYRTDKLDVYYKSMRFDFKSCPKHLHTSSTSCRKRGLRAFRCASRGREWANSDRDLRLPLPTCHLESA